MSNRRLVTAAAIAGAVAFAAACADTAPMEPVASLPETPSLFGGVVPDQSAHAENTRDARLARISNEVPGFAGVYRGEDGALNIMMAPSAQRISPAQARAAVGARLASIGVDLTAQPVNILAADYDFATLHALHRTVTPVLGVGGVVFTSTDEKANRVRIAVENPAAAASVEHALAMLNVDRAMVVISEHEPIEVMQTLQSRVRPVGGGLQIVWPRGGQWFVCTLGFNVRSPEAPNVQGFITNSHCTTSEYGTGPVGTDYWQSLPPALGGGADHFVGTEVHDLPTFTGGSCPAGRQCRWSDAAGVRYASGVDNLLGLVYRPLPGGSLTIDPANPTLTITAERAFPFVGDQMNKVGRTTGWSQGPVTQSCVNTNVGGTSIPNLTLLCQEHVSATVAGGDSGSPVFDFAPGSTQNIRLTGILWGGGGGTFVFSAMNEVRFENPPPSGLTWVTH